MNFCFVFANGGQCSRADCKYEHLTATELELRGISRDTLEQKLARRERRQSSKSPAMVVVALESSRRVSFAPTTRFRGVSRRFAEMRRPAGENDHRGSSPEEVPIDALIAVLKARLWQRDLVNPTASRVERVSAHGADIQVGLFRESKDDPETLCCLSSFTWEESANLPRASPNVAASAEVYVDGVDEKEPVADDQPLPAGLWLMDTGCGHDLISKAGAQDATTESKSSVVFSTANGAISTRTAMRAHCAELDQVVEAYVLPSTPWVLSIGQRCVEQGCSFVWVANSAPVLITPTGKRVELHVHRNIPYLRVGEGVDAQPCMTAPSSFFAPCPAVPASVTRRSETGESRALRSCLRASVMGPVDVDPAITDEPVRGEGPASASASWGSSGPVPPTVTVQDRKAASSGAGERQSPAPEMPPVSRSLPVAEHVLMTRVWYAQAHLDSATLLKHHESSFPAAVQHSLYYSLQRPGGLGAAQASRQRIAAPVCVWATSPAEKTRTTRRGEVLDHPMRSRW